MSSLKRASLPLSFPAIYPQAHWRAPIRNNATGDLEATLAEARVHSNQRPRFNGLDETFNFLIKFNILNNRLKIADKRCKVSPFGPPWLISNLVFAPGGTPAPFQWIRDGNKNIE